MKKLIHSQTSLIQEPTIDKSTSNKGSSKGSSTKLKLVVSNPKSVEIRPSQEKYNKNNLGALSSFTVETLVKGPCLYEMTIQDPPHYLACSLFLEVEENSQQYNERTVICHFPTLCDEELNDFVEEDETLYGVLMIQFQMKILEQLFLFCTAHYASTLVIYTEDAQADALGVYQDFLTYKDQTLTPQGEKTEMIISTDRKTFEVWIDYMGQINRKFQQALWRDQASNPIIRRYLKVHCTRAGAHEGQGIHNAIGTPTE